MERPELYLKNREEWRAWLYDNHDSSEGVFLILIRVSSKNHNFRWEEAVKEALCFGWIDSTVKRIDEERRKQLFTPRKPKSVWSKVNKNYIKELSKSGLMHKSGLEKVAIAKKNGSWTSLDLVENLVVPEDLQEAFNANNSAFQNFNAFSKTYKKGYLYWLNQAKREETRARRINEIIKFCEKNIKSRISR